MRCDHCKRDLYESNIQTCNHPAVNRKYGKHICIHCCKKCKHHTEHGAAIGCDLWEPPVDKQPQKRYNNRSR